jgi:phosphate transport system protein
VRYVFHDQLDGLLGELAEICAEVEDAVKLATAALLTGDSSVAERVISADAEIDAARDRVEDTALSILSLQAPVAGDLRVIVSALRMISELERMGDLAVHVAKIARLRTPNVAVPEQAFATICRMAEVAESMVGRAAHIVRDRDVEAAVALRAEDEEMDRLRRSSFTELLGDDWVGGVEAAVDVALLGRYYERIADHAVSVAGRVVFIVTGQKPTFT